VFFSGVSPYYFGYYGYPDYAYSTADYPGYDYYGPSYYAAQGYAAQNDIAQQQQDIDKLESEVARLREQKASDREGRDAPPPQPESRAEVSSPTVLIFRDKHTQEVQNYAIVGGTLWIFSEQRTTKLPLSWLDIEATSKANQDRGLDFQLPK
jgi:plasmid stabilization system protein ParE